MTWMISCILSLFVAVHIFVRLLTQSVEVGATRPVYYESRVVKLHLDEETIKMIDEQYDLLEATEQADETVIQKSKQMLGKMEAILGNPQTIDYLKVAEPPASYEAKKTPEN